MSGVDSSRGDSPILSYPPLPPPSVDLPSEVSFISLESLSRPADTSNAIAELENDQQLLIDLGSDQSTVDSIRQSTSTRRPAYASPATSNPSVTNNISQQTSTTTTVMSSSQQSLATTSAGQSTYRTIVPRGPQASDPPLNSLHSQHLALHSLHGVQPPRSQEVTKVTEPLSASSNMVLRVQYLEKLCGKLQVENGTLQDNFGRQRKKFMDRMLEMEAERSLLSNTIDRYSKEIREISTQLLTRDEELKNVSMAAKLSEAQRREDFDADRVKYEEEIASLTQILSGTCDSPTLTHIHPHCRTACVLVPPPPPPTHTHAHTYTHTHTHTHTQFRAKNKVQH